MVSGVCAQASPARLHWVGSWASSQQIPEPQNTLPPADLVDATVRQIVHLSLGGDEIRVRLSNAFGTQPLHFTSVHIARATSAETSGIDPATDRALTFGGDPQVTIPAGAEYVSDPIAFHAAPLSSLAISFHLDQAPARETGHPGSRASTYDVHGDHVSAAVLDGARVVDHWFQIAGVEVSAPRHAACIVALGDSITDGHATRDNANQRWTDVLAARLQAARGTRDRCVLNEGIGGNRLLHDGLGPAAMARLDRDVLSQPGARYLIVLEGINDIGTLGLQKSATEADHRALVHELILAYRQIIARAHAHGIEVVGGTIMPFAGSQYYHPDAASKRDREEVNAWIRASGHFDKVIDFDRIMRDPAHPDRLRPAYDSGDHLHPGPAGYAAMARAIPLSLFETR
ncbi:GDSL-like lipase/acylhydrolase family protein [Rhodanobacter sp. 115]|nr:GDSL-like lipase/acylhydrolase family protein [Rhodanobacter sp. 115]